jgi:hypothetical protein
MGSHDVISYQRRGIPEHRIHIHMMCQTGFPDFMWGLHGLKDGGMGPTQGARIESAVLVVRGDQ